MVALSLQPQRRGFEAPKKPTADSSMFSLLPDYPGPSQRIHAMHDIFTNMFSTCMVNVGKYAINASHGPETNNHNKHLAQKNTGIGSKQKRRVCYFPLSHPGS